MESILLSFCLVSLFLSSLIVAIELAREGKKVNPSGKITPLKGDSTSWANVFKADSEIQEEEPISPQTAKHLDNLSHQLTNLGYHSLEQQLGFVNWALNTHRTSLKDINGSELQYLFKVVRKYATEKSFSQASLKNA